MKCELWYNQKIYGLEVRRDGVVSQAKKWTFLWAG